MRAWTQIGVLENEGVAKPPEEGGSRVPSESFIDSNLVNSLTLLCHNQVTTKKYYFSHVVVRCHRPFIKND